MLTPIMRALACLIEISVKTIYVQCKDIFFGLFSSKSCFKRTDNVTTSARKK